jgi:hypothetical protein
VDTTGCGDAQAISVTHTQIATIILYTAFHCFSGACAMLHLLVGKENRCFIGNTVSIGARPSNRGLGVRFAIFQGRKDYN